MLLHLRYVFVMLFDSSWSCSSFDSSYTFLVLSAKINTFFEDRISRRSLSSLDRNLFLTGLNSIFRTISYRSFSNWFKCSFCGGVMLDLKPKVLVSSHDLSSLVVPFSKKVCFPSHSSDKTFNFFQHSHEITVF